MAWPYEQYWYKEPVDFEFVDYEITDLGIRLHLVSYDPGAGMPSDFWLLITDAELATVSTPVQFRDNLVLPKLRRRIRAQGIGSKLDAYIGYTITVP